MTIQQTLGICILCFLFGGLFYIMIKMMGLKTALFAWAVVITLTALVLLAVYLITGKL